MYNIYKWSINTKTTTRSLFLTLLIVLSNIYFFISRYDFFTYIFTTILYIIARLGKIKNLKYCNDMFIVEDRRLSFTGKLFSLLFNLIAV